MLGKVDPQSLRELVLGRTGAADGRVLQGPAYGEDTAAIRLGDELLVVNPDPISLAVGRVGTLGVDVACNDVAASGATPEWLTAVVFLPGDDGSVLDTVTGQLDEAASRVDVAIVGGHTEYAPALSTPMLALTCFGLTDSYVPTGGARPGDRLVLTKSAGVEATAIMATDFRDRLAGEVSESVLERAREFYDEVSVVPEAGVVSEYAEAMHDPTEGGLVDGLFEMAVASDACLEVDPDAIPVREETRELSAALGVDPLRTFGSGALLAAVPERTTAEVLAELDAAGIQGSVVGTVHEGDGPPLRLGEESFTEPVGDDMYRLWE